MAFQCGRLTGRALLVAAGCSPLRPPPRRRNGEVNVYTTREPGLIQPLLDAFTKETGIKVNAIFVESGLAERVEAEGENSPADVISVVDYGNLIDLVDRGLTQPVEFERARRGRSGEPARSGRELVRAVDARARDLRLEGPRERAALRPTRISPTRSGRAASASAPASTPTTPRSSPR